MCTPGVTVFNVDTLTVSGVEACNDNNNTACLDNCPPNERLITTRHVRIGSGSTLTLVGSRRVRWLVFGDVTIEPGGRLIVEAGPSTDPAMSGSSDPNQAGNGGGAGGAGGEGLAGQSGGGLGVSPVSGGFRGAVSGGGSGGAGGIVGAPGPGALGGAGGGDLQLAVAGTLSVGVGGTLSVDGTPGLHADPSNGRGGGGGGGGGGLLRFEAPVLAGSGMVSAQGGSGGTPHAGGGDGGAGGPGLIIACAAPLQSGARPTLVPQPVGFLRPGQGVTACPPGLHDQFPPP